MERAKPKVEDSSSLSKEIDNLEKKKRELLINLYQHSRETNFVTFDERHEAISPQATANVEKYVCNCLLTNCSFRTCGCMKRNIKCNPAYRCDDQKCFNQKSEDNQENKENYGSKSVGLFNPE